MRRIWFSIFMFCISLGAHAQSGVVNYCVTGQTSTGAWITAPCTPSNPLPVSGAGGGVQSSGHTVQAVIASTGTAVQFPSQPASVYQVCFVQAPSGKQVSVGYSSTITAPSATAFGNSSVGIYLSNGQGYSNILNNTNLLWINGNSGDGIQCDVH